jgi:hypothetical protein
MTGEKSIHAGYRHNLLCVNIFHPWLNVQMGSPWTERSTLPTVTEHSLHTALALF